MLAGIVFQGDERGTPARVLGVCIDVTEQKQAEQERERLHSLEVGAYAEAAERERISRELHDRVAHSMGVAYQSPSSTRRWRRKTPCGTAESYTRRRR